MKFATEMQLELQPPPLRDLERVPTFWYSLCQLQNEVFSLYFNSFALTWNPLEDNLSLTKQRKYGMLL